MIQPMKQASTNRVWHFALLVVGAGLSIFSLYLAGRDLPLQDFFQVILQARWFYVLLVFACIALNISAKTARWRVLLGLGGLKLPFLQILLSLMSGQLWNQVSPVRVGDLSRAWLPGFGGEKKLFILSTVALEKLLDTFFYGLLVFWLVFWAPVPAGLNAPLGLLAVGGAGMLVLLFGLAYRGQLQPARLAKYLAWLPAGLAARILGGVQAAEDSLAILRANFAAVFAWTLLIWLTAVLNVALAMLAMNIAGFSPPELISASILLVVALQAGLSLPSAPFTIGVYEFICKSILQFLGQDGLTGFVFGVFLHIVTMLPLLLFGPLGSFFTWYRAARK